MVDTHTRGVPAAEAGQLARNLRLVQSGRRTRAAGIRRCEDCTEPFIDDHTGLRLCLGCRVNHTRLCGQCPVQFPNTVGGDRLCPSCRHQTALFDLATVEVTA